MLDQRNQTLFCLFVLITALLVCYEFWYNTWKIPVKTVSSGYTIYKQTKAGKYASVHTGLRKVVTTFFMFLEILGTHGLLTESSCHRIPQHLDFH